MARADAIRSWRACIALAALRVEAGAGPETDERGAEITEGLVRHARRLYPAVNADRWRELVQHWRAQTGRDWAFCRRQSWALVWYEANMDGHAGLWASTGKGGAAAELDDDAIWEAAKKSVEGC